MVFLINEKSKTSGEKRKTSGIFSVSSCCLAVFIFFAVLVQASFAGDKFLPPASFSKLAEKVGPAVVNIRAVKVTKGGGRVFRHFFQGPQNDPFNEFFKRYFDDDSRQQEFRQRSLGSGFIIDPDGFIVTNNHVIEDAEEISVKLNNGNEYDASIVGRDPKTDLALIKVDVKESLPVIRLGNSEALEVGEWVVAIGSPFGLEQTVTAGIVSAKGRVIGSGDYDDFIQTDASINPGNSGGPLINMKGEVVGINTAIVASANGIGFAIPVDLAKGIVEQLKDDGKVTRGWLGVSIQDLKKDLADYYGVREGAGALVMEVFPNDPADEAGIKAEDVIVAINRHPIRSSRELTRIIADTGVGDKIDVKIFRKGKYRTLTVKIAKREDDKIASGNGMRDDKTSTLGVRVGEVTSEIAERLKVRAGEGVVVLGVEPGSGADKAGVMNGDIIKEINHMPVKSIDDYVKIVSAIKKGDVAQMFIRRAYGGFVVLKVEK